MNPRRFVRGEVPAAIVLLIALAAATVLTQRDGGAAPDTYASTDYTAGGYRAWFELMAREGVRVERFERRPIELDGGIDTLVSSQPPGAFAGLPAGDRTAADIGALARWVRAGGRLVYVGRNAPLRTVERERLERPAIASGRGGAGPLRGPLANAVHALAPRGDDRFERTLARRTSVLLADGGGPLAVRIALGRGEVIAVANRRTFANAALARADNARLAFLLARPRGTGGLVAFDEAVHGTVRDRAWYRVLPVPVKLGLAIAAVALALALGGALLRGGPAVRLRRAREPTSGEFVAALAALYERTAARTHARDVLAADAFAAVARAVGLGDRALPADVAANAALHPAGGDVARLARLVRSPALTDRDLIAGARLAHTIRKEFTHGGNGDGRRAAFIRGPRARRRR